MDFYNFYGLLDLHSSDNFIKCKFNCTSFCCSVKCGILRKEKSYALGTGPVKILHTQQLQFRYENLLQNTFRNGQFPHKFKSYKDGACYLQKSNRKPQQINRTFQELLISVYKFLFSDMNFFQLLIFLISHKDYIIFQALFRNLILERKSKYPRALHRTQDVI